MNAFINDENFFWRKKEFISFILSILVFFIHISSFAQYANSGSLISIINGNLEFFFKESITGFAVPLFFILSGISFFKGYENKKYLNKIKSRIFTLVIPFLLWNTIWMIFDIICSYSFLSQYFIGRQAFDLTFLNILKGIFFYKCNGPFWFVFNLIVFSLATPLIYILIRNKCVGILSVVALTLLAFFGIQIPASIFFSSASIVYYMIGAIIGKHFFDFVSRKSSKRMQYASILFLFTYIILKNIFKPQAFPHKIVIDVIIFTLCAFSLWNITDIFFDKVKPRKIHSRSFAIYAMHVNTSAVIAKLLYICLPKYEWMAIPNFIITVITTLILINLICTFLEKFLPKIYAILMGNRSKPSKKTQTTAK